MYTFGIPFRVRIVNEVMKTVILRILNPFVDILSFVNLRLYVSPFALMLKITKSYIREGIIENGSISEY